MDQAGPSAMGDITNTSQVSVFVVENSSRQGRVNKLLVFSFPLLYNFCKLDPAANTLLFHHVC